jgi:hypothetical protein
LDFAAPFLDGLAALDQSITIDGVKTTTPAVDINICPESVACRTTICYRYPGSTEWVPGRAASGSHQ